METPLHMSTLTFYMLGADTADTALRLAHVLGTSTQFWLYLQSLYELRIAEGEACHQEPSRAR